MHRLLFNAALLATASASAASAQPVSVTLTEFKVRLSSDTVKAGPITFRVKNSGKTSHSFYVLGDNVDKGTPDIAAGQESSLTVTLKAGTYEVFCSMSENSHKLAGMTRQLVVLPSDGPAVPRKPER